MRRGRPAASRTGLFHKPTVAAREANDAPTWPVGASRPRSFRLPIFLRPLRTFLTRTSLNGTDEHDTPEKSPVKPREIPMHRAAPACANARRRPTLCATPPLFSAVSRPTGASRASHPPRCKKSGRKSPSPRLRRGRAALANALLSAPPAPAPQFSAPCRALRARRLLPIPHAARNHARIPFHRGCAAAAQTLAMHSSPPCLPRCRAFGAAQDLFLPDVHYPSLYLARSVPSVPRNRQAPASPPPPAERPVSNDPGNEHGYVPVDVFTCICCVPSTQQHSSAKIMR